MLLRAVRANQPWNSHGRNERVRARMAPSQSPRFGKLAANLLARQRSSDAAFAPSLFAINN